MKHSALNRLLRIAMMHASGLDKLDRTTLALDRICVGCREQPGHRHEPVLGWVCVYCDEVLSLVYEKEISEVRQARETARRFIESLSSPTT